MNVLIMGGTTFFGKRLVRQLRAEGDDVTIATRGQTPDDFGDEVTRVRFDRESRDSMAAAFSDSRFDVVFDQIGYAPDDIKDACAVFADRIGHYVFTSSNTVYPHSGVCLSEDVFDPMSIDPGHGRMSDMSYTEGKQRAEAYLFQHAAFPVAAARFPVVLGPDDPTDRFQLHVNNVRQGKPFRRDGPSGRMSYIGPDDAGRFLAWVGRTGRTGPYNAACPEAMDLEELLQRIARTLGAALPSAKPGEEAEPSPFQLPDGEWTLDMTRAERDGFRFTPLDEWLDDAVRATPA